MHNALAWLVAGQLEATITCMTSQECSMQIRYISSHQNRGKCKEKQKALKRVAKGVVSIRALHLWVSGCYLVCRVRLVFRLLETRRRSFMTYTLYNVVQHCL